MLIVLAAELVPLPRDAALLAFPMPNLLDRTEYRSWPALTNC